MLRFDGDRSNLVSALSGHRVTRTIAGPGGECMAVRNMRNRDFAETRTPLGVIGGFIGLVAASAAAATLVVVGVTPAIATVGIAASGTIGMFENLPGYLEIGELSEKSNIYATRSDGSTVLLASFYDQNRVEVGWDAISQYVKDAAIAGEDPRFYEHGGIDLQGTVRAAVTTATGRETQGGSSIAQQYVKNVRVQECERMARHHRTRGPHRGRAGRAHRRPAACARSRRSGSDATTRSPRPRSTASSRRCASRSASRSATRRTRSCSAT